MSFTPDAALGQFGDDESRGEWARRTAELRGALTTSEGKRVQDHLQSYVRTVEAWRTFADHLHELLRESECTQETMTLAMQSFRTANPRDPYINALDAALVAYCAGTGAVIDQTRELIKAHGSEQAKLQFESRKHQMVEDAPSAEFLPKLRNYVLHYLSAPWRLSLNVQNTSFGQVTKFEVQLDKAALLEMKKWPAAARRFLEATEGDVHLTPLIEEFTSAELDLCAWAEDAVRESRRADLEATAALAQEYNLAMSRGPVDGSASMGPRNTP